MRVVPVQGAVTQPSLQRPVVPTEDPFVQKKMAEAAVVPSAEQPLYSEPVPAVPVGQPTAAVQPPAATSTEPALEPVPDPVYRYGM